MILTNQTLWLIFVEIFAIIGSIGFGQDVYAEEKSIKAGIVASIVLLSICQSIAFAPFFIC